MDKLSSLGQWDDNEDCKKQAGMMGRGNDRKSHLQALSRKGENNDN